eukprot:403354529
MSTINYEIEIDEDLIVQLNEQRRKLQKLFDQIPIEDIQNTEDLNTYREWILESLQASQILGSGLSSEILEEFIAMKDRKQQVETMQEELVRLEEENEDLKSMIDFEQQDDEFTQIERLDENINQGPRIQRFHSYTNKQQFFNLNRQKHSNSFMGELSNSQFSQSGFNANNNRQSAQINFDENHRNMDMNEKYANLELKLEDLQDKNKQLLKELQLRDIQRTQDIDYLEKVEKELKEAKSILDKVTKERDSLLFTNKEQSDLVTLLEDQKAQLQEEASKNLENIKQYTVDLKTAKDKQYQLQEYCSKLANDRNQIKNQSDSKDSKIKDLESVINNFATIQEHLVYKKTKKRETFTVDKIEEIFKQIQEQEKQRQYEEAVSSLKTYKVMLSPRQKHVTLKITDHEENITEHKIKVEKNELASLEFGEFTPEDMDIQQRVMISTDKLNDSFGNQDKDELIEQEKTPSEDISVNNNMFNRVNLRPFEIHSNTTSANVSRRGSFINKNGRDQEIGIAGRLSNNLSNMDDYNDQQVGCDHLSIENLSANVSRSGSYYGQHRPSERIKTSFKDQRRSTLFGMDFELTEEVQNDILNISQGAISLNNHSLNDIKQQTVFNTKNIFTQKREEEPHDQVQSPNMRKSNIQTPMFKSFNFKFDAAVRDDSGSESGESMDRQSAEQSKSLQDISFVEEHQSKSHSFYNQTKEQEIQTESPKIAGSGFFKLKQTSLLLPQRQDAETQMTNDDLKQYFPKFYISPTNRNNHFEESKETQSSRSQARTHRSSFRIAQKMDVYLQGEDLILKSPLSHRRTQQLDNLPQKTQNCRLRNLTTLHGGESIAQNRNDVPQVCCTENNCRIF